MKTIYLDVDGVINAVPPRKKSPFPRQHSHWMGDWSSAKIEGFTITWSHELVNALNELGARDDVEIKWLTTWQDLAGKSLSPVIGLNGVDWHFFTATDDELVDMKTWWKHQRVIKDIEENNPEKVVWIDDDIRYDLKAEQWAKDHETDILTIVPWTYAGITKEQMEEIKTFLA